MATDSRIYIVRDTLNQSTRLVRAQNPAQALRYVAQGQFYVSPAKADDLAELLGTNTTVENATLTLEAVHAEPEAA